MLTPLTLALTGILLNIASALASLPARRYPLVTRWLVMPLLGLSGVFVVAAGIQGLLAGEIYTSSLPFGLPWLAWHIRVDLLASFFLVLIGIVSTAVACYGPGYVREFEKGNHPLAVLGGFTGLFIAGMQLVVIADDAFLFMVAWELMSLSSYLLVTFQHENVANRRAGFIYLTMAEVSALAILLGFGVLAGYGQSFAFDAMREAQVTSPWASIAFALAFLGFGMKAGLLPVHAWLPEAHPVAPSHISALMSGVMLKVAVYGFIRFTFDLLGNIQWGWGVSVLLVGSISAVMGILYALMQNDLKRLLAYSSVENIGVIFIALGLSMVFAGTGHNLLAALGLVAALYHALNHAIFKGLLFLSAGAVLHTSHQRNMEKMGGLLHKMPWTGLFFLIGCISISALPPFNGFVSEWLTFQTALQAWTLENGVLRSLIPVTAAMLALTGALAAACFVKVYGVSFLGQGRSKSVRKAREVDLGMRTGQGILAAFCIILGIFPTSVIEMLNGIPQQLLGVALPQATAHGWKWLTPLGPEIASYSAPAILVGLLLAWWLTAGLLRRGRVRQVRRCDAWDCGFSPLNPRMQYTATGFAQPIRRVFGLIFSIEEKLKREKKSQLRYELHIQDRIWGWLYAPIARSVLNAGRIAGRLQSGNVRNYLGWTLVTLLVLLWLIS